MYESSSPNNDTGHFDLVRTDIFSLLALVGIWCLVFYVPTLSVLVPEWWGAGSYNYGLFNSAIAVYLVYQRKQDFEAVDQLRAIWFWPSLILIFAVWQFADVANIRTIELIACFALLFLLILKLFGSTSISILLFPAMLIVIALPIWRWLQQILRDITTEVSDLILSLTSLPYLRTDYRFELPGGIFDVEPGCSGFNFFMIGLTLSIVFSSLNRLSWLRSALVIGASILIALIGNWLRVIIIILVGNETKMQHPLVADHLTFGWILYLVLFIPLFFILTRLASAGNSSEPRLTSKDALGALQKLIFREVGSKRLASLFAIVLIPVFFVFANYLLLQNAQRHTHSYTLDLNDFGLEFEAKQGGSQDPYFPAATSQYYQVRLNAVQKAQVFMANYGLQREGLEITDKENRFYPESWNRDSKQRVNIKGKGSFRLLSIVDNFGRSHLMLTAFRVGDSYYDETGPAKLASAIATLKGRPDVQVVSVRIPLVKGQSAESALSELKGIAQNWRIEKI